MSLNSPTTMTVIISIILATTAFLAMAITQPMPQTQVTVEQAINILRESGKTDHFITDQISPQNIRLEYISINWQDYLWNTGYHTRLYVSTTHVGEVKPYWVADYDDTSTVNLGGAPIYGRYVVDAQTGEVMLSLESGGGVVVSLLNGGGHVSNILDFSLSLQPDALNQTSPLKVKMDENTSIRLTLTAELGYDASLPVSIKVLDVPLGFSVEPNKVSVILETGGAVSFTLTVFTPVSYLADFLPSPIDPHPHFDVQTSFLGQTDSYPVYIIPSNK